MRTHIGFGSPNKQDTQKAHGSPLGADEVRLTKEAYGWDPDRSSTSRTRCARSSATRSPNGRARSSPTGASAFEALRATTHPGPGRGARAPARGRAARRLGRRPQDVRGRRRGRDAEGQPGGDPGPGAAPAGAVRRRRGPVRVEPDRHQGRAELRAPTRPAGTSASASASTPWAASPTASPTTAGSSRTSATFLNFSDYMRGSVRLAALSGLHVDLRLDPRLGRARRGRPDAPAGRALRGAAGDPEPVVRPARRRQRDGRRPGRWPSSGGTARSRSR